jgi:ADP-ribose pyrophosphatase
MTNDEFTHNKSPQAEPLPWQVLRSRPLLDCSPWFRVLADDVLLPDGQRIENYYRIEAPDFVMIFPLGYDGRVLVLRGYKHGAGRVMLQLPAGYMDRAGESSLDCARRELLEETGHVADEWWPLGRLSVDGNRGMGHAHLFLARGLRAVASPDSGDLETLVVEWLSLGELRRHWRAGEFDNTGATAIIGLALAALEDNDKDRR